MTSTGNFYEDDEPVEDVEQAFTQSDQVAYTLSPPTLISLPPTTWTTGAKFTVTVTKNWIADD